MKKRLIALMLLLALLVSVTPLAYAAEESTDQEYDFTSAEFYAEKTAALVEIIAELGLYYDGSDILQQAVDTFCARYPDYSESLTTETLGDFFADNPELYEEFANTIFQLHDGHSYYMEPITYESSFDLEESYVGVGVELDTVTSGVFLVNVFPNSPADEAGLLAGDRIVGVDGVDTTDYSYEQASQLLRGEENTDVEITVLRGEQTLTFTLTRRMIVLSNVDFTDLGDGVAYIRISRFGDMQTFLDFLELYQELPYDGFRSVIIDLRFNLGGNLDTMYNMLNYTLWQPDLPMFGTYSRDEGDDLYTSMGAGWQPNLICVLVNEYSASASEIFAGALATNDMAVLIGTTTHGKGVGQYHIPLIDESTVVITNFELYVGDHELYYNEVGITPDIEADDYSEVAVDITGLNDYAGNRLLRPGMSGQDIVALEERLLLLGMFEGTPDQHFDLKTLAAVRMFQTEFELPVLNYVSYQMSVALKFFFNALDGVLTYANDPAFLAAYELALEAAEQPLGYELLPRTFEEHE